MASGNITIKHGEYRPCLVNGRRALFHRWVDSARLIQPRNVLDETDENYQYWSVHGLVEYEDGKVDRVWPYEIRFIDGGAFEEWDWNGMEARAVW